MGIWSQHALSRSVGAFSGAYYGKSCLSFPLLWHKNYSLDTLCPPSKRRAVGLNPQKSFCRGLDRFPPPFGHLYTKAPPRLRAIRTRLGRGFSVISRLYAQGRGFPSIPFSLAIRSLHCSISHLGVEVAPQMPTLSAPSNHSGRMASGLSTRCALGFSCRQAS